MFKTIIVWAVAFAICIGMAEIFQDQGDHYQSGTVVCISPDDREAIVTARFRNSYNVMYENYSFPVHVDSSRVHECQERNSP